jgi:hypothetical protein
MEIRRIIIAMLTCMVLIACSNDNFLGEPADTVVETTDEPVAVDFGGSAKALTRASHTESAALLNNKFYIYGSKTSTANTVSTPFDNYLVQYTANSKGSTATNTDDWEYTGLTSKKGILQSTRYWDFSARKYDFVAFAGLGDDELIKSTTDAMRIHVASVDAMSTIYVADRVTATPSQRAKTEVSPATEAYGSPIQFQFRRLGARMRIGFYETIPGYAVKDLVFYYIGAPSGSYTVGTGGAYPREGTYSITYSNVSNEAHSTFIGANNKMDYSNTFGLLSYTSALSETGSDESLPYIDADGALSATPVNAFLGTTAAQATFGRGSYTIDGQANVESDFKPILPNENNTLRVQLRLDYTLVATDGSGEELHIRDAYVSVPVSYLQWRPNYSYTYLFRITEQTNGFTGGGGGDPSPVDPGRDPDPDKGGDDDPVIDPETGEPIPPYVPDPSWPKIPDPDDPDGPGLPDPDAPLVPNPDYPKGPGGDQHDPSNPVPDPDDPDNPSKLFPITFDAVVIDAEDGTQTIYKDVESGEVTYEEEP